MRLTLARRGIALGAWLITLGAVAGPACSEPPAWLAIASVGISDSLPRLDGIRDTPADESIVPVLVHPDLRILTTSVAERESTDLRLLVAAGERWHLMELGATLTLRALDTKVSASGQVPYAIPEPAHEAPAADDTLGPASLSLTTRVGGFEAGVQYRSAGKRLERLIGGPAALRDREGHEVWVAQRVGMLRFRLADSELTDNVDRNPALPRTTKDQSAVTAELTVAEWPVLGVTLASGESARIRLTREGWDGTPERHTFESVTGSAYYDGGPSWSVSASSTFSRSRHVVRPDDGMAMTAQDVSLTLHPFESLTVTPTLSLVQERYTQSGLGIDTSTAGCTLSYAPPRTPWSASSFVSYTTTRATDASTDARSVSVSAALTYALGRWLPGSTVSFSTGYDRFVDAAGPGSVSEGISGFVFLKLVAF